jgi:hypothetical protein
VVSERSFHYYTHDEGSGAVEVLDIAFPPPSRSLYSYPAILRAIALFLDVGIIPPVISRVHIPLALGEELRLDNEIRGEVQEQ